MRRRTTPAIDVLADLALEPWLVHRCVLQGPRKPEQAVTNLTFLAQLQTLLEGEVRDRELVGLS